VNHEFIEALRALEKEKGINKDVLIEAIETALVTAYKRDYGADTDVRVTVNRENGKMQVLRRWNIVAEIENPDTEVLLEQAKLFDPGFSLGDVLERDVTPKSFGRIAAQTAKQIVVQRIREEERSSIYDRYVDSEDEIINAVVKRMHLKKASVRRLVSILMCALIYALIFLGVVLIGAGVVLVRLG